MASSKQSRLAKKRQARLERELKKLSRIDKRELEDLVPKIPHHKAQQNELIKARVKHQSETRAFRESTLVDETSVIKKPISKVQQKNIQKAQRKLYKQEIKRQRRRQTVAPTPQPTVAPTPQPTETLTPQETEYIPRVDHLAEIRSRLEALQRGENTRDIPIETRKNALLDIFDDTYNSFGNTSVIDDVRVYEEYLLQHIQEIAEAIAIIEYDSSSENVEHSFARLARILNMGALSITQAESVSQFTELNYGSGYTVE